jgi:hypothetical protein
MAVLVGALLLLAAVLAPAPAGATPVFLSPVDVSDAGQDGFEPQVAADSSGNSIIVWTRSDGANSRIQAKFRAANGTWGPTETISDPLRDASEPQVAFDPSGNAIAVWSRSDGTNTRIQSALRPANGSFGAAQTVSAAGQNASRPQIAIDSSGKAVADWERTDGTNLLIQAAVRPSGGSFGTVQTLSDAGQDAFKPRIAAGPDVESNAVAAWTRFDGANLRVQASRRKDVAGYARPKSASPLRAALVVAFNACGSGNSTHGAPLSFASCKPPVKSSSVLTVGTADANGFVANSVSSARFDVMNGDPSNNVDDADVRLSASMTDVRNSPSGTPYTGRLLVRTAVRITDRNNAPETPAPGTLTDFNVEVPFDCVTVDPSIGSTCSGSTTLNALVPGMVAEGQRSIWDLGQIQVYDAGPNGTGYAACPPTCGDGDESVFMRQGVFIP